MEERAARKTEGWGDEQVKGRDAEMKEEKGSERQINI